NSREPPRSLRLRKLGRRCPHISGITGGSSKLELRPYVYPRPPQSPPERTGITCVASHFLVKKLPENYPFVCSTARLSDNFQFPFFCFSGPDPPPVDFGSLGDLYVAPAANALYAYLPSDGLFEDGAWTRWSAVRPASDHGRFQFGETGLLQHPFFPERVLWVNKAQARASKLFAGNEDVATVTNILVAHTLQTQNGDCKVLSESSARKHRLDEENEASKEARKKLRSHQDASYSQHQQQQSATISNLEGNSLNEQLCKQASIISGLEEDKAALKMSLDNERRGDYQARGRGKRGAAKVARQAGGDHRRLGEGESGPGIVTG
ncbi:hypothetical protein B0H13DRAFT_2021464, partial [Mycena leptocephala]